MRLTLARGAVAVRPVGRRSAHVPPPRRKAWIEGQRQATPAPHAGEALRAARHRRGLTQAQVAERMGLAQPQVSKLERRRDVRLSTARAYVAALGGRLRLVARFDDGDVELE